MRVPVKEEAAAGAAAAEAAAAAVRLRVSPLTGVELRASGGLGKISW